LKRKDWQKSVISIVCSVEKEEKRDKMICLSFWFVCKLRKKKLWFVRRKKSAKNNVNRFDCLICYSFFVGEERGIEKENKNSIFSIFFIFHKIIEITNWIIREENPFSREWIGEQWKRVTLKRERNYFFWKKGISTKLSIFWVLIGLKFDDFMFRK